MTEASNNEFSACDMATAAAQGFRDGVASVTAPAQGERDCMSDHAPRPSEVPYPPSKDIVAIRNSYGPMSLEPHEGEPVEHLYGRYELRDYGARCIAWDRATRPAPTAAAVPEDVLSAMTKAMLALEFWNSRYPRLAKRGDECSSEWAEHQLRCLLPGYREAMLGAAPSPEVVERDGWISVEDRLPQPNTKVLAFYTNEAGKGRRVAAEWIAKFTVEASADCWGDGADYDEATDQYYSPEGWYECVDNWDELAYLFINEGTVTHWMPLPAAPALSAQGEGDSDE